MTAGMATSNSPRFSARAEHAPSFSSQRALLVALLVALVWAPIPLGSNRPWSLALLAGWVWLVVLFSLAGHGTALWAGRWPATLQKAGLGLILASGCVLWVAMQLGLSGTQAGIWFIQDDHGARSYLLRSLTYLGAMLAVVLTLSQRNHVLWVLGALLLGGLIQALISVSLYARGTTFVYWFDLIDPTSRPSGTFVNPDHLAGYLEIALSAGVGLMLALMSPGQRSRNWAERLVSFSKFLMSPKMLVRLTLVLLVIALVLTRSRAGNGAFFIGILLVGSVVAWRSAQWRRPALWLVASMLVVDLLIIGQWVGLDTVVNRLKGTAEASSTTVATFGLVGKPPAPGEQSLMERLEVPISALALVQERPIAGWGGNGFALAYPKIKPDTLFAGFWDHAHNDYVQVAVDMGLVGLTMWVGIGVFSLFRLWPLLGDSADRTDRGVAVAVLMVLCCLGIHSMVDFNLHIPANAVSLSALLALLWALPGLPKQSRKRSGARQTHRTNGEDEE
jgi:O-antigen ligase